MVVYRIVGGAPPTSWGMLLSVIVTIVFTILMLWIPATALMFLSVIFGYPYNKFAGISSTIVGISHVAFAAWTYFYLQDKTLSWLILALVCLLVGFTFTYLGLRLLIAYRKKGLVEFRVIYNPSSE